MHERALVVDARRMILARLSTLFAIAALLTGCAASPHAANAPSSAVIENYIAALNRRDLLALTAYVTPDVEWFSSIGGERILEVSGRDALAESLRRYFANNQATRWTLGSSMPQVNYIAARERSTWRDAHGAGSRESLCVYELQDGRIRRITQFLQ